MGRRRLTEKAIRSGECEPAHGHWYEDEVCGACDELEACSCSLYVQCDLVDLWRERSRREERSSDD